MKIILKDNVIYTVDTWDTEKGKWVCQNIRTKENRLFSPTDVMRAINTAPSMLDNLTYQF